MLDVAWRTLIDALAQVEGLAPDDSGLLSFGVVPGTGGIFVEKNRICWAAALSLKRRLRDLLSTCTRISDAVLDETYERCRLQGKLLGQTLVDEGLIGPSALEIVLRRHSAESLVELCRTSQPTMWSSRGGVGYAPLFTFRPVDVLLDVGALFVPDAQDAARAALKAVVGAGQRGAAFYLDPALDLAVPVAEVGHGVTVHDLRTLGRWAMSVRLATRELGTTPAFTLAATAAGDAMVVWWRGALLYAVACEDRPSIAAITAHHLATL